MGQESAVFRRHANTAGGKEHLSLSLLLLATALEDDDLAGTKARHTHTPRTDGRPRPTTARDRSACSPRARVLACSRLALVAPPNIRGTDPDRQERATLDLSFDDEEQVCVIIS